MGRDLPSLREKHYARVPAAPSVARLREAADDKDGDADGKARQVPDELHLELRFVLLGQSVKEVTAQEVEQHAA